MYIVWWQIQSMEMDVGFSKNQASHLHKNGSKQYKDLWKNDSFLSFVESFKRFKLKTEKEGP